MKSFHDSLSTPYSEPLSVQRPLYSPDLQEEKAKADQQTRKVRKAAKKLAQMLSEDKSIKIARKKLQDWITVWIEQTPDTQPVAFCSFFAAKLVEELARKKGQNPLKSHKKTTRLILGRE